MPPVLVRSLACVRLPLIGALLVLCASALAQQAPPRARILVKLEGERLLAGSKELEQETVINALQLRVRHAAVEVLPYDAAAGSGWLVKISEEGPWILSVYVTSPTGQLLLANNLSTAGRDPEDVAHTIALMVVESLSSGMPELGGGSAQAKDDPMAGLATAPPPVEQRSAPPPARSYAVALGATAGALAPQVHPDWGLLVSLARNSGWHRLELDAGWWFPLAQEGADYHLDVQHGQLRLASGVTTTMGDLRLYGSLGPLLRIISLDARGEDLTQPDGLFVDGGLGLRLGGDYDLDVVHLGLSLDLHQYLRFPRFVIDGERVLDMGHTWAGLNFWLAWDYAF